VLVGSGLVVFAGVVIGGAISGLVSGVGLQLARGLYKLPGRRTVARLPVQGAVLRISREMIDSVTMGPGLHGRSS
jgi:hypothetical protein